MNLFIGIGILSNTLVRKHTFYKHKDGMTWNQEEVGKVRVGLVHESVYWVWYTI